MASERIAYLDILKIFACLLVIALHTVSPFVSYKQGSVMWFIGNAFSAFTYCAVPLFLMASGALMLGKDEDVLVTYRKAFRRYFVPTVAALVYYKIFSLLLLNDKYYFKGIFYDINASPGFHLWYMWLLIGVVTALPVFRQIVKNESAMRIYIVAGLFFSSISPILGKINIHTIIQNPTFVASGVYFVSGYYFNQITKLPNTKYLALAGAVSLAISYISTVVHYNIDGAYTANFVAMPSITNYLFTSCLFLIIKSVPWRNSSVITNLSRYTYPVYILHFMFLLYPARLITPTLDVGGLLFSAFIVPPLVFCACSSIAFVVKRIPYLRYALPY